MGKKKSNGADDEAIIPNDDSELSLSTEARAVNPAPSQSIVREGQDTTGIERSNNPVEAVISSCNSICESWRLRIAATNDAAKRSRYAFGALTVVSVGFIISIWNAYFSWGYQFARAKTDNVEINKELVIDQKTAGKTTQDLNEEQWRKNRIRLVDTELSGWVTSQRISVPLLGVSVSSSDTPWLGAISLYVLSLWFYFCVRRENHLVASLLRDTIKDTADSTHDLKYMVFHGVASQQVMTRISETDDAIFSLVNQPRTSTRTTFWEADVLIYLPIITMFIILGGDVFSLFIVSPFRAGYEALFTKIAALREWLYILSTYGFSLVFMVFTLHLCWKITDFQHATQGLLREYFQSYIKTHRLTDSW